MNHNFKISNSISDRPLESDIAKLTVANILIIGKSQHSIIIKLINIKFKLFSSSTNLEDMYPFTTSLIKHLLKIVNTVLEMEVVGMNCGIECRRLGVV